jgi:hypothetical protein
LIPFLLLYTCLLTWKNEGTKIVSHIKKKNG